MSTEKESASGYLSVLLAFFVFVCFSNLCLAEGHFNFQKRLFYNSETGQELCFYCQQSPNECKCTCNHCCQSVRSNNQQTCQCHTPNAAEDICKECMYPKKHCSHYKCRHGLVDTHHSQYVPPLGRIFHPGRSSVVFFENTVAIISGVTGPKMHKEPCDYGLNYHCLHYHIANEDLFESIEPLSEKILDEVHSIFVSQEMSFNFGAASSVSGVSDSFCPLINDSDEFTMRYFIFRVSINRRWHFILIVANNSHALVFYSHQKVIYGYHHTIEAVNEHIITALRRNNKDVYLHRIHAVHSLTMANQLIVSQVVFEVKYGDFDAENSGSVDDLVPEPEDSEECHEDDKESVSSEFESSSEEEETSTDGSDNASNPDIPEPIRPSRKRTYHKAFGNSDDDDNESS